MKAIKYLGALTAAILGLGLVLDPRLISSLPAIIHYILGGVLIVGGIIAAVKIK